MAHYDIGFLGGGQLARMSVQAAQRMGLQCLVLEPSPNAPACQITDSVNLPLDSLEGLVTLLERCDHVTLENEFIPADLFEQAVQQSGADATAVIPSPRVLGTINDKLTQRHALADHTVASPRAVAIDSDFEPSTFGFPMVIKARFGGYDGKGTRTVQTPEEFEGFRSLWCTGGWLAEDFVPFRRELAVMVYRSDNEVGCFPTMETVQTNHVCDLVFPSGVDASSIAVRAVEAVQGYGLFGVELFELENGEFQVNEIAPRPHNTGHYSLDWGGVSQFEQHIRLVMGWSCALPTGAPTCMANLLGQEGTGDFRAAAEAVLRADPNVHFHWYGKAESRPGRKMGHINVTGDHCTERAISARDLFYSQWSRA